MHCNRIILLHSNELLPVCVHTISLNPPLYIEVLVSSRESERSCICMLKVSILALLVRFLKFIYWNSSDGVIFCQLAVSIALCSINKVQYYNEMHYCIITNGYRDGFRGGGGGGGGGAPGPPKIGKKYDFLA